MAFVDWKDFTNTQKGIFYFVGGVLILLYAFNIFQEWLNFLVICLGFFMVGYGFYKLGGVEKIQQLVKKTKKEKE